MHLDFVNDLLFQYGLYAVFILVMLEGDITLLLAGVLAHSAFFGDYSFARVLLWGTIGGCLSDNLAYFAGRGFCEGVKEFRFYRAAQPRLQTINDQIWPALDIPLQIYLWTALGVVCVLWRRANALPAVPGAFVCELFPVGFCTRRRRLFL